MAGDHRGQDTDRAEPQASTVPTHALNDPRGSGRTHAHWPKAIGTRVVGSE